MSDARRYSFILLFLVLALYIAPLGMRPMFVPDESRYAEVPREMIASGDWASPHLNGLRYFEKPALGYWVTAASIMVFGENNFAIRLPSALSVALTAFFIFSIVAGSGAKKDETSAPLAALVFLTSLEVYAVGTFCVLDSLLSCFITGTMASFYLASIAAPGSRQEKKVPAACRHLLRPRLPDQRISRLCRTDSGHRSFSAEQAPFCRHSAHGLAAISDRHPGSAALEHTYSSS